MIKRMVAIAAGKGGVGKSSLAVNLAFALQKQGHRVGLLDADVYGPSLEQMLPKGAPPSQSERDAQWLIPGKAAGIALLTAAYFYPERKAAFVRAPVANALIDQFLNKVEWGDLDFLIVDFPPGTGDVQLTLLQRGAFDGALLITTPQEVALLDVRKAASCFAKMHVPLIGVVENMSYLEREGKREALFGKGGGLKLAQELSTPLLGEIPIDPQLSEAGDLGVCLFDHAPDSPSAQAFTRVAHGVQKALESLPKIEWEPHLLPSGEIQIPEGVISAALLQDHCPCVRCGGVGKSSPDTRIIQLQKMGRFVLKVNFTSGCSQGLYPRTLLAEIAS